MFCSRTAIGLLALLLMPSIVSCGASLPNTHCRSMQFADYAEIDSAFIVMRGVLGPNEFFKAVRCVSSADVTVFTGEALTFPNRLTITLFIIGPMPKNAFAEPKKLDSDYMLGLSFSVNWKRGVKMRPVKSFRELTASESQPPDFAASLHVRQCWVYEFVVRFADKFFPVPDTL